MKQQALQILQILEEHGHQARLAGGCVRDLLLNITPKDYDIATTALPEQVIALFEKTIPTGIDHGTVTVMIDSEPFEVTTLRKDVATDGRRATIEYATTFEEDSLRRDFTINAMYQDKNGAIYDYHNGQRDLKEGRLMFVGNAEDRIKEDYLRILRFFRFSARFKFTTDFDTVDTIYRLQSGLSQISRERVNSELLQILNYPEVSKIVHWMQDAQIFTTVLGKFARRDPPKSLFEQLDLLDHLRGEYRALAKLATYLGSMSKASSEEFLRNSKLSLEQQQILEVLIVPSYAISVVTAPNVKHKIFASIDKIAKKVGEETLNSLVYPYWAMTLQSDSQKGSRVHEVMKLDRSGRRTHKIPITGNDLIARGIRPGHKLGELLKELRNGYWDETWTSKEEGLKYLEPFLGTID